MKGMVFTEFVEFIEEQFGFEVVDAMIENAHIGHEGAYTQAGNYPFSEMVAMVSCLSEQVKMEVNDLIEAYGKHLFGKIIILYPQMGEKFDNTLDFVAHVESFIHVEVKKLYPDAELPSFDVISHTPEKLVIDYHSDKPLVSLAKGLILGCTAYYEETIEVVYEVTEQSESNMQARITLTKK